MLEEFHQTMTEQLGVHLTQAEMHGLLRRYKPELSHDGKFNMNEVLHDIRKNMKKTHQEMHQYDPSDVLNASISIDEILRLIEEKLSIKSANVRGSNLYQKAFIVFGNNRNAYLSKNALKSALIFRLALTLHPSHIESIFQLLDVNSSGYIKIRDLIDLIYKRSDMQVSYLDKRLSEEKRTVHVLNAIKPTSYVDYSGKFQKLFAPPSAQCIKMGINELEEKICNKIVEKVNSGQTIIQSVVKAFGDDRESRMLHRITLEQLKYTIWNKFQFLIHEESIEMLYRKYDPDRKGFITLSKFIDVSHPK